MKTKDKILFIEDLGEYLYHIDRMMISLKRNGFFSYLKGLIVGSMINLKNTPEFSITSINEIILDVLSEYNFPVVFNFPAGHGRENLALILGKEIILSSQKDEVSINYI